MPGRQAGTQYWGRLGGGPWYPGHPKDGGMWCQQGWKPYSGMSHAMPVGSRAPGHMISSIGSLGHSVQPVWSAW